MEIGEGGEGKPPPEGLKKPASTPEGGEVKPPKRQMKSPYQLELLEKTYAVETYPSEALRAELSVKTGLSDRQLQMWFCHRRLKDRKFPPAKRQRKEEEPAAAAGGDVMMVSGAAPVGSSSNPFAGGFGSGGETRKAVSRAAAAVSRIGAETSSAGKRYYEPPPGLLLQHTPPAQPLPLSMAELRVIASVEAQLGEPLREDGPILGVEFDPLPPGAFGAPIAMTPQQKQPLRPYDGKLFERHDGKAIKASTFLPSMEHCFVPSSSNGKKKQAVGGSNVVHPQMGPRALHEYQFLPEQPSVQSETYDRFPQSHLYDSSVDAPGTRMPSLPSGGQYLHGNEQMAPSYTFQGQMTGASLLSRQGSSRMERKRKNEEARIAKEVEAHERRIRKELEKQDILRRKREEQMRREMERHDRERRKEEERMVREKQREEERFQREQKRELERREKFLLKESRRAEKMKQKEELRREKEAARLKAANERATARRLAREYTELIEDERLELMELAASSKGLPAIFSLDSDTLQQLDSFRDMLSSFPPKSVRLKRPFAIQPWRESDENLGNLFMVWKFLITFADILGLWPFTLDEFVQSLHDYDSRLLGEIHVALLKSIIKDIEDVARTPAMSLGANQNSAANPGGGHPQIVEGAYAWGFNICSWQRHLNCLTWPEILRQFALSSGFGPQLKKRNVERVYFRDDNEGNDGEDVISTLRNGSAAENAAALMQEKGYTHRRRSRHRLTPGTVKFAAFHVLSLEGSKGLTILEVADKIQKSGLRDLTTSKTPEASIAAALSRDTRLFERTAPSTYCVRSPFRKDPADAEAILSAAREKIQIFQSGLSDSEEAEKDTEYVDDAERDEDSECDAADGPEIDDVEAKLNKNIPFANELKVTRTSATLGNEKDEAAGDEVDLTPPDGSRNVEKGLSIPPSENTKVISASGASQSLAINSNCHEVVNADMEDTEIDESNFGAPWVQGLTEGDYFDLSVEERLNALVALIGVAIEGNSIRVILEERLEAANALKKQMWSEAQLDKRRFKEEYASKLQYSSFMGSKAEATPTNAAMEEGQTPLHTVENQSCDGNPNTVNSDQFVEQNSQINVSNASAEKNSLGQDFSSNADTLPLQQYGCAAEKSRSQLKSYIGHKAEQLYVYRSLPLGQDRRRNRYWQFSTSASPNDPGSGRIFFESKDGYWRVLDSEEAFDALLSSLDTRGIRESHLHSMLQRIETTFKEAIRRKKCTTSLNSTEGPVKAGANEMMSSPDCSTEFDSPSSTLCGLTSDGSEFSTSFMIDLGRNEIEKSAALKRYQGYLKWMWKECYNPHILCAMKYGKKRCSELLQTCHFCYQSYLAEERHCPSCHKTFKTFYNADANFSEHVTMCEEKRKMDPECKIQVSDSSLPIGINLLKAQLAVIEVSIPSEALQPYWTEGYRKSWGVKLHSLSSAEELFQILTLLEGAIKRDCLSSDFETTTELLSSTTPGLAVDNTVSLSGSVPVLPWVPDTAAAVALRLLDLDSSISYMLHQKLESHKKEVGEFIKLSSRYAVVKSIQELDPTDTADQLDYLKEAKWLDPGSGRRGRGRGSRGRGGRGRGRGGRGSRGNGSSTRAEFRDENINSFGKTTRKYARRGRTRGRGGRRRGRRTVRPRQRSESRVPAVQKETLFSNFNNVSNSVKHDSVESPRSSGGEEWGLEETSRAYIEDDDNSEGSQSDENGQASGDEYDDQSADYVIDYDDSKPVGLMDDESEEDDDAEGDEEGDEDIEEDEVDHSGHEGLDADLDDEDEEEIGDDGEEVGDGVGDGGEGASSFSSEYSD
ncbi:homeobox-DDT domain protein RLT2-like isoform X2 [Phoenix dactylifera]|uniref:Homeobox-DDT domain protein RLT2-like isoform X2 n=1 Tax=Phoenix dactylifera TaxID=42345 RepID=A0A8B7D2X3_PHODC|nr:homeobox-DDT domain protein RLT2-like isoform X2 [Phoenix dactylifera]